MPSRKTLVLLLILDRHLLNTLIFYTCIPSETEEGGICYDFCLGYTCTFITYNSEGYYIHFILNVNVFIIEDYERILRS